MWPAGAERKSLFVRELGEERLSHEARMSRPEASEPRRRAFRLLRLASIENGALPSERSSRM